MNCQKNVGSNEFPVQWKLAVKGMKLLIRKLKKRRNRCHALKTEKQLPETKQSGWTVVHRYLGLFSREEAVEKIIKVHMEAGEKQNDR